MYKQIKVQLQIKYSICRFMMISKFLFDRNKTKVKVITFVFYNQCFMRSLKYSRRIVRRLSKIRENPKKLIFALFKKVTLY